MTLFTFNSKALRFLAVGCVTFVVGVLAIHFSPWRPSPSLVVTCHPPIRNWSQYFLSYGNGEIDHFTQFYNLGGVMEPVRSADVLFLGNSRAKYAFRRESFGSFFSQRHLRPYVMAFGHRETSPFPEAIIKKYDLRPRWVIINADPFFSDKPSPHAEKVMNTGRFESWKIRFQESTTFWVQHVFHHWIPYFSFELPGDAWVEFRSVEEGTLYLAGFEGHPKPVSEVKETPPMLTNVRIQQAIAFKKEMERRGSQIVLTSVPPSDGGAAKELARILGVPLIQPTFENLMTLDGSHLDERSAGLFTRSFLEEFGEIMDGKSHSSHNL